MKRFAWFGLAFLLMALFALPLAADPIPGEGVTAAYAVDTLSPDLAVMACDMAAVPATAGAMTKPVTVEPAPRKDDGAGRETWNRTGGFDVLLEFQISGT